MLSDHIVIKINKNKTENPPTYKLIIMPLNNLEKEEITMLIRKYFGWHEMNENVIH